MRAFCNTCSYFNIRKDWYFSSSLSLPTDDPRTIVSILLVIFERTLNLELSLQSSHSFIQHLSSESFNTRKVVNHDCLKEIVYHIPL